MTWNQFRHWHRQPKIIAAWRRLFDPALQVLPANRRRLLLAFSAVLVAVYRPWRELAGLGQEPASILTFVGWSLLASAMFGFVWLSYLAAKQFSSLPLWVRRHPQISLHAFFWIPLIVLWSLGQPNPIVRIVLAGWIVTLPFILWRVGHMMLTAQHGKMERTRFADHLFYCYPVWTGSDIPYGKGWDYLSANEAKDEQALAKSQLAGLKLFLLAGLWAVARDCLDGVIFGEQNFYRQTFGSLSLPVPHSLFAQPGVHPIWIRWAILYLDLVRNVLTLAVGGHIIIGWLRFFGFNVFRNTYKPLLSESVVEFWNRYFYYFKELLLNFFFYPTFSRYLKGRPRIRLCAAVFAAAFAGNVYYHLLGLKEPLVRGSLTEVWATLQSRVFYCFLLAAGIAVSMLREQRRAREKQGGRSGAERILAIFLVWTFFALIHIWSRDDPVPFTDRCKFFLGLFGLP